MSKFRVCAFGASRSLPRAGAPASPTIYVGGFAPEPPDRDPDPDHVPVPSLLKTSVPAFLLLAACATAQRGGTSRSPADLEFPPEEVKASSLHLELQGKNDEELFAIGTAAYGAADHARAAAAFARLADLFPTSRHQPAALTAGDADDLQIAHITRGGHIALDDQAEGLGKDEGQRA